MPDRRARVASLQWTGFCVLVLVVVAGAVTQALAQSLTGLQLQAHAPTTRPPATTNGGRAVPPPSVGSTT